MPTQQKGQKSLLLSSYSDKEVRQAIESLPSLWAATLRNEAALPLSFAKRKFLIDIYNDFSPRQVLLKPPQIGASTMNTLKVLYVARFLKKDIIYTMPTDAIRDDFVTGTINRIVSQNEDLAAWVKDHDSVERKEVGNNIIRFRGTFNPKQAMTVPASLLVHDEVDASDLENITLYETRQEAQEREEDKWRWYFSHPSLVGSGVDVYWQLSDKKEWYVTCPHCQQSQTLTWPASINKAEGCYQCRSCRKELPDEARINGAWRATADGSFSGYHVSQLMLYNKSAKDIIDSFNDPQKDEQYFYNYVLGLPYQGGDDQITAEQVLACCKAETNEQKGKIIIGVDPGKPVYYVCMNEQGIFYYNRCASPSETDDGYEDLRRLLRRWPTAILITDAQGEYNPMLKMQHEFPGRIFRAFYNKDKKTDSLWEWGEKEDYGIVHIDRNRTISWLVGDIKNKQYILNGERDEWTEFAEHFAAVYKEKLVVKEQKGKDDKTLYGAEYVWKRRGADHWLHATLYAAVGYQKYGQSMAKVQGENFLDKLRTGVVDTHYTGNVILRAASNPHLFE